MSKLSIIASFNIINFVRGNVIKQMTMGALKAESETLMNVYLCHLYVI